MNHTAELKAALEVALEELNLLWDLTGQNLEVAGWHRNGDLESLDSFFEENSKDARDVIRKALALASE